MLQTRIIMYCIRLILGGFVAFLAILLWSRTRDSAWMALVAGAITRYAEIVYSLMSDLGIIVPGGIKLMGIPIVKLLFEIIPSLFFILAFILMLIRNKLD